LKWVRENWPLMVAIALLWWNLAVILERSLSVTGGRVAYGLDDAYIHMALAKHLVQDGVWGVTKYGFSSSQSSLLWPLLLALPYLLVGPSEIVPLALNIVFATLLVGLMFLALKRAGLPNAFILLVLVELIIFVPLPWLVFTGMEHLLQASVDLAFVCLCLQALTRQDQPRANAVLMLALVPLITAIRYEGLFLIAAVMPLFLLRRRWALAIALAGLAAAPLAAYGVVAVAHGGHWLPNSVLLKNAYLGLPGEIKGLTLAAQSRLLYVAAPCALLFGYGLLRRRGIWRREQLALLVFLVVLGMQALLAKVGLLRYDAYLVALGLYALAVSVFATLRSIKLSDRARLRAALVATGALVMLPIGQHGMYTITVVHITTANIYQQQYQMGRFLRQYYQGAAVAANDIGAVNYLADIKLLDLWGLGSPEVAAARLNRTYNTATIRHLARAKGVKVAIAYRLCFTPFGGLPREWVMVGKWRIPANIICAEEIVTFYAVDPSEAPILRRHLLDFSSELPPQVEQSILQ
jgi:hypothetical protein